MALTQNKFLDRDTIKYIAMFTMLLNHIAQVFLTPGTWIYEIFIAAGYFTAITMIYFLAEGYHYTHSRKAYLKRLFLFGLLAEIPYCLAFTTDGILTFYGMNMLLTLCLCFCMIWIHENVLNRTLRGLLYTVFIFASTIFDWGLLAPIYTLLFTGARGSESKTKRAFAVSVLLFGAFNLLGGIGRLSAGRNILCAVLSMLGMGIAAVCILYFYNGEKSQRKNTAFTKWFFYLFYPVHLLLLGVLRVMIIL